MSRPFNRLCPQLTAKSGRYTGRYVLNYYCFTLVLNLYVVHSSTLFQLLIIIVRVEVVVFKRKPFFFKFNLINLWIYTYVYAHAHTRGYDAFLRLFIRFYYSTPKTTYAYT